MVKKLLKTLLIVFIVFIGFAISVPYIFEDEIKAKITKTINESVDATILFEDADISLFKNFPNATVSIKKFTIINKAPFAGDTLVAFDELNLKMAVTALFNGDKPIAIQGINSKNGLINIIFNEKGLGNFDIALKNQKEDANDEKSKPLSLQIKEYEVSNFKFRFTDKASKIKMTLDSINHTGKGDFANDILDLNTKTTAKVGFEMNKMPYLKNVVVSLDAIIGVDLKNSKYTFKENKAKINELPLAFDGFIQMLETGQLYDLTFKTPTSSFKNFLGLIPAAYQSSLKDVKTTGDCSVSGFAKGELTDTTIPKFSISIQSNNASFQYVNLPKAVKNIILDTQIINETGLINDTYVNLNNISFQIDKDVFKAKATIKNVAVNALVNANLIGTINLGNLSKAYPIQLKKPLSGILNANMSTKFDMQSVEKSQYQNIINAGSMKLSGFKYTDDNNKSMLIDEAQIQFNPSRVVLQKFVARTGKSDMSVTGTLDNFYGFLFRNQELKGNFILNSNTFAVADFMTTDTKTTTATPTKNEAVKIPGFLNCTLTANAKTVLYDNLVLKDVSGKLLINNQKATLQNVKTSIFGGQISFNGLVSTKDKIPNFNMNLGLNEVNIAQSFSQLEMLKKIAPIAGIIDGKLNSTIALSGNLDAYDMTPNLKTLSGDLFGKLLGTSVNAEKSTLLSALDDNLKFIDLKKLNLNDVKAALSFKDGKVTVKPFDIKYQDMKVTIGGTHGFDQMMNYALKFDIPAKYLGNEANAILSKLSPADVAKLGSIPVNASLGGNFSKPKISTDLKQATTNLVNNIAKQQKSKLVSKGTNELEKLLNKNKKVGDTTKTSPAKEDLKNKAKDLLNGLFK
jgi:AsmA-like C-terminal region